MDIGRGHDRVGTDHSGLTRILIAALASACLLLVGCAGSSAYEEGQKLLRAGDYDGAVTAFQQAVAEDPDNRRYYMSLSAAQSLAADAHVEKAQSLLEDHRASDARQELELALAQMPAHPQAIRMVKQVDHQIQACDKVVAEAREHLASGDWARALQIGNQAYKLDASHPGATEVRNEATAIAVGEQLIEGKKALEARDWDQCKSICKAIRALDPDNEAADKLEKTVEDRQHALRLVTESDRLIQEKEYARAVALLRQAGDLWPENDDITSQIDQVTDLAVGGLLARSEAEIAAGRFPKAIAALDEALDVFPDSAELTTKRKEAIETWADASLDTYEQWAMSGRWPLAWPAAMTAMTLSPDVSVRATQAALRAEQLIREDITYNLSVVPLKSSTAGTEHALAVCRELVAALGRVKPDHVQLLERTNLADVLAEHDLSLANITDPDKLGALGRQLDGTDIFVFAEVNARESTNRVTERQGTSRYVAGKKLVPNPDYAKVEREVEEAEERLAKARAAAALGQAVANNTAKGKRDAASFLADAARGLYGANARQAADAYNAAVLKLNNTPQRLEVDDWREHKYPIFRVTRQVIVDVNLRLVEVATGRILWSDNETQMEATHSDLMVEANADRGVDAREPVLRSEEELRGEAISKLGPALYTKAHELLLHRSKVYWEDASKSAGEQATEGYVLYLFDSPAGPDPKIVDAALDGIFGSDLTGDLLERCKELVIKRLDLERAVPPAPASAVVASPPGPTGGDAAPTVAVQPQERARPLPSTGQPAAEPVVIDPIGQPDVEPARDIFRGAVSRDDDRYREELETVDGITIEVKDTDPDPLDADIEIRVNGHEQSYRNQRVGARIRGRGRSGERYVVVIVAIEDDDETVHFTVEPQD